MPTTVSTCATSTCTPWFTPRRAPDQRRQRRHRAEASGHVVGIDRRRARGRVGVGVVPQVHETAGRLGAGSVAPPPRPRAVRTHELARHHHQLRVDRMERVEADTELVHRAGRVVLDHQIGPRRQLVQDRDTLGGLGVHPEPELAAARRRERRVGLTAELQAHEIGVRARLDLHHLGAVLGEAPADLDTDRAVTEVHDPQAGERRTTGCVAGARRVTLASPRSANTASVCSPTAGRRSGGAGALAVDLEEPRRDRRGDARRHLEPHERAARLRSARW